MPFKLKKASIISKKNIFTMLVNIFKVFNLQIKVMWCNQYAELPKIIKKEIIS